MNATACARLTLLTLGLASARLGVSQEPATLAEGNRLESTSIIRARAAKQNRLNQEKVQLKVAIPKAVAEDVEKTGAALPARPGTPPPKPTIFDGREDYVRLGLILILMGVLARRVLLRHQREAEVRKLCGGYLSDGTAVANYKLPEWFTPPSTPMPAPEDKYSVNENPSSLKMVMSNTALEFFDNAPRRLAKIREVLKKLGGTGALEERKKTLLEARELVCEIKDKSNCWELRPAWQMSSALELLLKGVADKPKDATASVLRTIAAAVDVLHEVCVPGVRPNLLIDPPIKILAVDDDALCRRALEFALEKASLTPDVAENGEKAVKLAEANGYDIVFMDIQMPGIDGLAACRQIHATRQNAEVPVVFVTVQSDFNTRAESRITGGADLMAKPFLLFELTVRTMTVVMSARLKAAISKRNEIIETRPVSPILQPVAREFVDVAAAPPAPAPAVENVAPSPIVVVPTELKGTYFREAPEYLAAIRKMVETVRSASDRSAVEELIGNIYLRVHTVAAKAALDKLPVAAGISAALEALLKRLYGNLGTVSDSTLNTASLAIKLLEDICSPSVEAKLACYPDPRILVVDDEPLARKAIVGALQLAFEQPDSANDGAEASALAAQKAYDVVFTDLQMPGKNGFELCSEIRAGELNRNTPVVFITNHADVEAQNNARASGGNDFIGKPFLPIEIAVKALIFTWDSRLRKTAGAPLGPLPEPENNSISREPEPETATLAA